MSDLKVDCDALVNSVSALTGLKSELDDIEGRTDDTAGAWGHGGVKDAMHEFSHNMDYNRKKLTEKVQVVGQQMSDSLHAFEMVEADLVKSLTSEGGK